MADDDDEIKDVDDEQQLSHINEIIVRHRKEKKELQAKITSLKRSVDRADKKRKKDVAAEILQLEADIDRRHTNELAAIADDSIDNISLQPREQSNENISDQTVASRITKAEKRRRKKEEDERRRYAAQLKDDADSASAPRTIENRAFNELLAQRGLRIHEVAPDGDCLYNAIAHQLSLSGSDKNAMSAKKTRSIASRYMQTHRDDFQPFLTDKNGDPIGDDDQFDAYCRSIIGSDNDIDAVWGGEPEIRALSMALERTIEVVQIGAPSLFIGESAFANAPTLIITYHRHAYGLGEHYNSTCEIVDDE